MMLVVFKYLLLIVEVVVGFMLVGIILLQRSKDSSMGLSIGQGVGESLFGARAGNVLQKITVVMAVIFFFCTIALARVFSSARGSSIPLPIPVQQAQSPVSSGVPAPEAAPVQASPANFGVDPSAAASPAAPVEMPAAPAPVQ